MALTTQFSFAQSSTVTNAPAQYCQITAERKVMSRKMQIELDMGDKYRPTEAEQKMIEEVKDFNSLTDAINLLARNGWEVVSSTGAPNGNNGAIIIYTLRKKQ